MSMARTPTRFYSERVCEFCVPRVAMARTFGSLALSLSLTGVGFAEGKVGVNKPELLPKVFTTVIDVCWLPFRGSDLLISRHRIGKKNRWHVFLNRPQDLGCSCFRHKQEGKDPKIEEILKNMNLKNKFQDFGYGWK